MADPKFTCRHCNQSFEAPGGMLGQTTNCPSCGHAITLTESAPEMPAAAPSKETKACPFCGEEILAQARKCRHCGEILDEALRTQMAKQTPTAPAPATPVAQAPSTEKTEYESHPSMFRSNPIGFVLVLVLCFVGVGFVILLFWWLSTLGTTLTVTNKRSILRKGILSKRTSEVRHEDVRNIQISQSFFQRILGVGTVGISSAGQADIEIEAHGMPDPAKVKQIIDKYRMG